MPWNPTIAWLTFRQLFVRRRLITAVIFALAPTIAALVFRSTHPALEPEAVAEFVEILYPRLVIGALLPLAAVVIGTSAFGGEIDDGTVVYLLVKPIPRWHAVITKYIVAVLSIVAVMVPATLLPYAVFAGHGMEWRTALAYLSGAGVGALLYGAIFIALGVWTNRALVFGLLYVVVLEMTLSQNIAGLRSISVRTFATSVAAKVGDLQQAPGAPPLVDLATVWTMGAIILIAALALAIRRVARYEMAERGA